MKKKNKKKRFICYYNSHNITSIIVYPTMHSLFSIAYGKQQFITNLLSKHNSCTFTVINLYTISKLCSWSIVPVIRNLLLIYKLCVTGRMDSSCLHH